MLSYPSPKAEEVAVQKWQSFGKREKPSQMAEISNLGHVCADCPQNVGFFPINQHVRSFAKGKIDHDVEGKIHEPPGDIYRLPGVFMNDLEKIVGVF